MDRQILIFISLAALIVFYCTEQVEGCSRRRRRNCDRPRPVVCTSGYTNPPSCNIPICSPSCSNGGTCIRPDTCRCPYGWTGALCDKAVCPAGCVHGNCVRPGCCICYSGWHGTNCNTPVCSGGCNNGGTCISPNRCQCRSGWQGSTCNEAICSGGCKNGGICIWPNTCRCAQGWTGNNCEQAICLDSCYHGGSCIRPETCQCAYGWEGKSCKDAICQKTCQNGAVCTQPNMCACPLGWTGDTCEQVKCGSEFDCYPGTCQDGTQSPTCECVEGFTGQNCEEINIKPRFETCEVSVLSEVPAYLDVTASCDSEVYTNLTSMVSFTTNILLVFDEPQYVNEYPKGGYLRNYKVGLINASYSITTTHADDRVTTNSYKCSTDVHTYNPLSRISCRIKENYKAGFVHDDVVEVKAVAISGGYKEVRKEDTGNEYRNITFNGEIESKSVLFRIDHKRPRHCSEDSAPSCETPLSASNDVTDVPYVSLLFAGWSDADSGISEYRYSIYQMTVNGEGELQENTNPVKTDRFSATNTPEAFFTLPSFGMYSIIGEVVDQAGNIGFCRALVLYVDKEKPIERKDKSLMATNTTNTIGNVLWRTDTTADINISWKGIFSNPYLENYSYLAKVKASPVKNIIDYMNGNISTKGIPNRSGITEFQYQKLPYIQKSEAAASRAKRSLSEPPQTWISTDLSEEITINSITSGQGITLWVKAKDILGNFLTDYWYILADNSPPQVTVLEFKRNVTGPQRGYYSSVDMEVRDTESGVFRIDYTIYDTTGNPRRLINKSSQSAQLEYDKNACILNGTCSCTDLQCYANVQRVFINNCIFVEFLDVPLQFVAEVYNSANLSTSVAYDLGKVEAVSGIDEYPPPYGFFVERAFGSGALLSWYLPNACYSIFSVNIDFKDGTGRSIIHPNRTSAELDGLKSHTMYTVELYIIYENRQKSERVPLSFDSGSYVGDDGGLSVGAIIGIVIGVLFFIAIIAIVVLMLIRVKMKNKPAVPHNITRTASNAFSHISKYFADKGMTNILYGGGGPKLQDFEDDIYVYGEMDTDPNAKWKYSIDQVSMSKLLRAGRFAEIRLGTLKVDKDKRLVAVKMLKEQTEDNIRLMKAKMNFLATAVPHHNNIVNFIGAVTEGSLILLEYCEHSLKDWLKNIKEVTDEVEDNMVNFCTDIARGMAHLHSNEIVHRRLGARNVLLKQIEIMGRLVAKVTGFGPMKGETLEDAGPDHIPIKWMAPEQIGLGKNAKRPYDKKTDVWSYGITIWEIYSKGNLPFSGLKHSEVKRMIMAGERPERPSSCSEELYDEIMMRCWEIDPSQRPQISEIRSKLERIFHGSPDGDEYYADDYDSGVIYDDTMSIP